MACSRLLVQSMSRLAHMHIPVHSLTHVHLPLVTSTGRQLNGTCPIIIHPTPSVCRILWKQLALCVRIPSLATSF
eukprot:m.174949 g.174949  ORF g.174949 m.174949 type:complete len:75 (-) comp14599_c0_seq3:1940-2164(-)